MCVVGRDRAPIQREWRWSAMCCLRCVCVLLAVLSELRGQLEEGSFGECPDLCRCSWIDDRTDCSRQNLSILPAPINAQVKILDLSFNFFKAIPGEIASFPDLDTLYLHHNMINSLNELALNRSSIRVLDLSHNDITWDNINGRKVIKSASSMKVLHLSHNPIGPINEESPLSSGSLDALHLEHCSVRNVPSTFLQALANIRHLSLASNLLTRIPSLRSHSLLSLNLSRNAIEDVSPEAVLALPSLKYLILTHNPVRNCHSLKSNSLEHLDISFCNIATVSLKQMANLKFVSLRENHIRKITRNYFSNSRLEYLDLSMNSIHIIEPAAFANLTSLVHLDLSMNLIVRLHSGLFSNNTRLKILNLSHNYLTTVSFHSKSLRHLDMSSCEIQAVNENSLSLLPSLQRLELSRNLIRTLPNKMDIQPLEYLDVSMNKLSDITNTTFSYLVSLKMINLRGNRFTAGLKAVYFPANLNSIVLDDNLWICNCFSVDFRNFYDYITKSPPKVAEQHKLICHSPENVTGLPWQMACSHDWFDRGETSKRDKAWLYVMSMMLAVTLVFCSILSIKKIHAIKSMRQQRERERIAEEARERIRRLRMHQRQSAQQNAPDPRELQRPPSYAEALLMPRLDGSNVSLPGSRLNILDTNAATRDRDRIRQPSGQASGSTKNRKSKKCRPENNNSAEPELRNGTDSDREEASAAPPRPVTESSL